MPDDSNWKTPVASPRASIAYVFLSSSGIFPMSRPPPMSVTALSITSRLRRPRKSIFSRPSASIVFIENCVTISWSAPFCCSGTTSISGADHDAGGVDRVLPRQPFERAREVDDLARDRIGVVRRLQVGAGLEAVLE